MAITPAVVKVEMAVHDAAQIGRRYAKRGKLRDNRFLFGHQRHHFWWIALALVGQRSRIIYAEVWHAGIKEDRLPVHLKQHCRDGNPRAIPFLHFGDEDAHLCIQHAAVQEIEAHKLLLTDNVDSTQKHTSCPPRWRAVPTTRSSASARLADHEK